MKRIFQKLRPFYLLAVLVLLCSHNLYIKMDTYFLKPNQQASLSLYNGSFEKSENIIARDRILDASIVANGSRLRLDPSQWKDKDSTLTQLNFTAGEVGTYVAGVSTKPRNIELKAEKFNNYLKHDGVLDMLEERTKNNLLNKDAVESYQKHVKAIYQVGDTKTDDWKTVLGYPIEFVPQENPYTKYSGSKLAVQLLLDGKPLSNQLVYADHVHGAHDHSHGGHEHKHDGKEHAHKHDDKHEHKHKHKEKHGHKHKEKHEHKDQHDHKHDHSKEEHVHTHGQKMRTDDQGIVTVDLTHDGIYFLRTIHMESVTDDSELTHQSKWATLTFEVTHKHGKDGHSHDHHDHEEGIPTWIFVLGSVVIIGLLFIVFRKKS